MRMPSHSPQDYLEDPAVRRRGTGKSRSKYASPENGLDARNGQRSPYGRLGDRAGGRNQYRDAKQHRYDRLAKQSRLSVECIIGQCEQPALHPICSRRISTLLGPSDSIGRSPYLATKGPGSTFHISFQNRYFTFCMSAEQGCHGLV